MVSVAKLFFAIAATSGVASALTPELDLDASRIELLEPSLHSNGTRNDAGTETQGKYHGALTFYAIGLGACGIANTEADPIVAMSSQIFDPESPNGNGNNNPLCGRNITIRRNGTPVTLTVADSCGGCTGFDLDVPVKQFAKLADPAQGRVEMSWDWA